MGVRHVLSPAHRLRVFQNVVPRGIFGPERDEVAGEGRNLRSRVLLSCCIEEEDEMGGTSSMHAKFYFVLGLGLKAHSADEKFC
jgi:hypothetical protein